MHKALLFYNKNKYIVATGEGLWWWQFSTLMGNPVTSPFTVHMKMSRVVYYSFQRVVLHRVWSSRAIAATNNNNAFSEEEFT